MSKVEALRARNISPQIVLETLATKIHEFEDVFVVGITSEGDHEILASGDLSSIGMAILCLQRLGLSVVDGSLAYEGEDGQAPRPR